MVRATRRQGSVRRQTVESRVRSGPTVLVVSVRADYDRPLGSLLVLGQMGVVLSGEDAVLAVRHPDA